MLQNANDLGCLRTKIIVYI